MKHLLTIVCCILVISLSAQVTEITPLKNESFGYGGMRSTNDSNLFLIMVRKNDNNKGISYINNTWTQMSHDEQDIGYYFIGNDIYATYTRGYSSTYRFLERWNGKSWDSINVKSLNFRRSWLEDLTLDDSNHLVATGIFTTPTDEFYMAKLIDSSWKPIAVDQNIINSGLRLKKSKWKRSSTGIYYCTAYNAGERMFNVLSWDGKNIKILKGSPSSNDFLTLVPASNGKVYGINSGLLEWNGVEWKPIPCTISKSQSNMLSALAINDKDELFVGGLESIEGDALIMKYSNGTWEQFATVPAKYINELFYLKGTLYVSANDRHNLFMLSADKPIPIVKKPPKPVGPKPTPVDYYHEKVWSIYKDFMARWAVMNGNLNDIIGYFEDAENQSQGQAASKRGLDAVKEINTDLNQIRQSINNLNVMPGKNILVDPLMDYINAYQRYTNSWGTIFSCYIKADVPCLNAESDANDTHEAVAKQKREVLVNTAEVYKKRNGLD